MAVKLFKVSKGLIIAPDPTRLNSTSWIESDRVLWSLLQPDSTQLNSTGSRVFVSFCQFWTFQL